MVKLFVEDDEDILFIMNHWLQLHGFDAYCFNHSRPLFAAVDLVTPHLILLDVNLRGEDGRGISRQLRNDWKELRPIILISANSQMRLNSGGSLATAFVKKPFELKELKDMIDAYLALA